MRLGTLPRLRLEHLLFSGALMLLFAQAGWWAVAMDRAVQAEFHFHGEQFRYRALAHAEELTPETPLGPLQADPELELTETPAVDAPSVPVRARPGAFVQPGPDARRALQARRDRRGAMVAGEGAFFLILIGICTVMLFRLVRSQRQAQGEIEQFVGQVTHEMKTPLTGLKTLLQTMQLDRLPAPQVGPALELGLKQIERQQHLIENLLAAQRLRQPIGRRLALQPVDLEELLREFRRHRAATMLTPPERYQIDVESVPCVLADRDMVWTILENLTDNADKYGATRIELRLSAQDGGVLLSCRDDGIGFETGAAEELFAAFRRRPEGATDWQHGTGLGLHISRELARAMGGDLSAASAGPGTGASFELSLPGAPS